MSLQPLKCKTRPASKPRQTQSLAHRGKPGLGSLVAFPLQDEIIQQTITMAYVEKLGLPSDANGELATLFREANGEVLFSVASKAATGDDQPGATLQMQERRELLIHIMPKMNEPQQPALVRGLAAKPKDIEKMIYDECTHLETLLRTEQISRLQELTTQTDI